jgi:hypothetical protein
MTLAAFAVAAAAGFVAALLVHELGHVLAAGALGGHDFRLTRIWPVVRVEAELPPGAGHQAVFLASGAIANVGAAGALVGWGGPFAVAGCLQVIFAVVALLPIGESDGARLWRLWRGQGPIGM